MGRWVGSPGVVGSKGLVGGDQGWWGSRGRGSKGDGAQGAGWVSEDARVVGDARVGVPRNGGQGVGGQ